MVKGIEHEGTFQAFDEKGNAYEADVGRPTGAMRMDGKSHAISIAILTKPRN